MPGFSIYFSQDSFNVISFKNYLSSFSDHNLLSNKILFGSKDTLLSMSASPNYPYMVFETEAYFILLEGRVYNFDNENHFALRDKLIEISKSINSSDKFPEELINGFDGEYVIVFINKVTNKIKILNDQLARLPVYFFSNERFSIITREISFLIDNLEEIKYNKIALSEYLIFGYSLGTKTIYEDVFKMKPNSVLNFEDTINNSTVLNIFNFENVEKSYDMKDLLCSFEQGLTNRVNNSRVLLGLSGGLDSRAVAAALKKIGSDFVAITRANTKKENLDFKYANIIAQNLNIQHLPIKFDKIELKEAFKTILLLKRGFNGFEMHHIIPYLKHLKELYSDAILLTGDGGDKTNVSLYPIIKIKSFNELLDYTLRFNAIFSITEASNLLGISEKEIRDNIKAVFDSYPENNWNSKYVHFLIYERSINWLFEGEDRNRYFLWSTSPFYSYDFFSKVMRIHPDKKERYSFYKLFLKELDKRVYEVPNPSWKGNFESNSFKFKMIQSLLSSKFPKLSYYLHKKIKGNKNVKSSEIEGTLNLLLNSTYEHKNFEGIIEIQECNKLLLNSTLKRKLNILTLLVLLKHNENQKYFFSV